jgi:hypothetical protein
MIESEKVDAVRELVIPTSHENPYIFPDLKPDLSSGASFKDEDFGIAQFLFERVLFIQIDINQNGQMSWTE